jgi:hypothetical protein
VAPFKDDLADYIKARQSLLNNESDFFNWMISESNLGSTKIRYAEDKWKSTSLFTLTYIVVTSFYFISSLYFIASNSSLLAPPGSFSLISPQFTTAR